MKVGRVEFGYKPNIVTSDFSKTFFKQNKTDVFEKSSVPVKNQNYPSTVNYKPLINFQRNTQKQYFYSVVKSLLTALEEKNPYTYNHSLRVALYTLIFTKQLNFPPCDMEEVELAGILHDMGKIATPNSIICKEGKLTEEEYSIIKNHSSNSERLLQKHNHIEDVLSAIKHHHERWDGKGYPDGLKGEEIPYLARIIAIADTYDAMTSARPYRPALSHEEAIEEIKRCSGTQFDPKLVKEFLKINHIILSAKNHQKEYTEKYSVINRKINLD